MKITTQGNYGIDDKGHVVRAQGISIPDGYFFSNEFGVYRSETLKPIPLTEKIMSKCEDFQTQNERGNYADGEYYDKEEIFGIAFKVEEEGVKAHGPMVIWDGAFTGSPCEYVHQLQNLYSALKGVELKFTL